MGSYNHSYVIPYTVDSNFDEIAVDEALDNYLRVQYYIEYCIRIARNRTPLIYTNRPLTPEMVQKVERLVNRACRRGGSSYY